MITRFDHAVIAVSNLDEAMTAYTRLGFAVSRGGRHPGRGTENAIVRFGLEYLELLAMADEAEARRSGWDDAGLATFALGGLIDYALASDDLAADAARLRSAGFVVQGPFDGSRRRPDGALLVWQTLRLAPAKPQAVAGSPQGLVHAREPWPFLIEWRTPDAERIAGDQAGPQPNRVTRVWGISVMVLDLDAAVGVYQTGLGLQLAERARLGGMAAERARFTIGGGTHLDLLSPMSEGPVAEALAGRGEGLFSVVLAAPDLAGTERYLATSGVPTSAVPGRTDEWLPAQEATHGARLVIRAAT